MNKGWRKLMAIARGRAGLICPLCENPNDSRVVRRRQHPDQARTNPNMDPIADSYRSQWECAHCGAWNTREQLTEGEGEE